MERQRGRSDFVSVGAADCRRALEGKRDTLVQSLVSGAGEKSG